jgi:hypothetical protein
MYKNLCEKYDLTVEEIKRAVDEISKHGMAKSCCNTMALVAVADLLTSGDVSKSKEVTRDELEDLRDIICCTVGQYLCMGAKDIHPNENYNKKEDEITERLAQKILSEGFRKT